MATLTRLEVWTDLQCNSGTRQAIIALDVCESLVQSLRVTREDIVTLRIPTDAPSASELAANRVLRLLYDDASFDEYRIYRLLDSGTGGERVIDVEARGLMFELRDGALLTTLTGTVRTVGATFTGYVATVIDSLLTYLPSWWDRGTVPSRNVIATGETPLEVLRSCAKQIGYEVDIRRNGTVGYYIDIVSAVGASAATLDVRANKNLLKSERTIDRDEQATIVVPTCADGTTIAQAKWVAASVSGTTIELRAPETGAACVAFDDQYNGLYLANDENPTAYTLISDSTASGSTVVVASATGITTGDLVRIVSSNAGADQISLTNPSVTSAPKVATLNTGKTSAVNHAKNPLFNDWTAGAPDDWTTWVQPASGAPTPTLSQESSLVQNGTYSVKWTSSHASFLNGIRLQNAPYYFKGSSRVRIRATVYTSTSAVVRLAIVDGTGAYVSTFTTYFVDSTANGWRTIELDSTNSVTLAAQGPCIAIATTGSTSHQCVVDAVLLTINENLPTTYVVGSGLCDAWVAGNAYLVERTPPAARYRFSIADLHALAPTEWPDDELVIGQQARVTDPALSLTTTQRIMEIQRNWRKPDRGTVTLSRTIPTLTGVLTGAN